MRLEKQYLGRAYHEGIIAQYEDQLKKDGFSVEREKKIGECFIADLYAHRGNEKHLYEFKLIGDVESQHGSITRFMKIAESIGAEPHIKYLKLPNEKQITFDDLGDKLAYYLLEETIPELDSLSTHTRIEDVYVEEIETVEITDSSITVSGAAQINVNLQYGSDSDVANDSGYESSDGIPMDFTVEFDLELNIVNLDYKIDVSDVSDDDLF